MKRRTFIVAAASWGAAAAWGWPVPRRSQAVWRERRALFPEGVASGDPDSNSVLFWTRYSGSGKQARLTLEVAEDELFERVTASAPVTVSPAADWTCRVLVGGLKPARVYWYRFSDPDGNGSRIGRTITAPAPDDPRPVNFAFVSCQDVNEGKLNAYRRMIYEDERAPAAEQLDFVLHLGDFIYEVVEYPDEVKSRYDRTIYEVARIPDRPQGRQLPHPADRSMATAPSTKAISPTPTSRTRARAGRSSPSGTTTNSRGRAGKASSRRGSSSGRARRVKVAANQAWFEYLPARVSPPSGSLEHFGPPAVKDVPIDKFDRDGLGVEPNNLTAINSLKGYRAFRYGQHLDLIITDQHSYRSADRFSDPSLEKLGGDEFMGMFPESVMQILDGGRGFNGGKPPAEEIRFNDAHVANPQRNAPPQTILGAEQKAWFKDKLKSSTATWKIWANSQGALDERADPQNLPPGLTKESWPERRLTQTYGRR